jgi:hypothetical protein
MPMSPSPHAYAHHTSCTNKEGANRLSQRDIMKQTSMNDKYLHTKASDRSRRPACPAREWILKTPDGYPFAPRCGIWPPRINAPETAS